MESNTKQLLAVFSLMLGLSWGIPYLVSEEKNSSWLMLSIIFLVLALLLWLWIMREQRSAEESANDALDAAEGNIKKVEAQASDDRSVATESADSVPVADASSSSSDSDSDEVVVEETKAEELVEAPSTPDELEEVSEEAKEGDPVADKTVSEASAAPETEVKADIEVEDSVLDSDHDSSEDEDTGISVDVSDLEAEEQDEITNDMPADAKKLAREAVSDSNEVDLTIIEGIGPKYAAILNVAGIHNFSQLAAMTTDEIVDLVKANGGRKSGSMSTWADQARLAAAGDWDGLEKLQDDLTGGRR